MPRGSPSSTPGARSTSVQVDGEEAVAGEIAARVGGPTRAILAAERTALNFATRLSGIATLTRRFVDAVAGHACRVLDTRKTTPGWRALEKHAVRCGGGTNHRRGLFDVAMLKDTHLAAAGSMSAAVAKVRERWGESVPLVVECAALADGRGGPGLRRPARHAGQHGLEAIRSAVALAGGRASLEASGGVTLETARLLAETGVDFISVGALTHSAPALDLSMEVQP